MRCAAADEEAPRPNGNETNMERLMNTESLTYEADGLRMVSHFYYDGSKSGRRPGVLVFPEGLGLNDHARSRAERLAEMGWVALACDLHGEGRVLGLDEHDEAMALIGPLRANLTRTRARAVAGLDALKARAEVDPARIAAIGFCFGGTMALELARSGADVVGVVGFHSGLSTAAPEDAKQIRGKVLVCIGADDPGVPLEQRHTFETEMREGGIDWQMNVYGGVVHGFTNPRIGEMGRPDRARYDAQADARSWTEMRAFLDEVFRLP
jgi:dienelactone hydrolase